MELLVLFCGIFLGVVFTACPKGWHEFHGSCYFISTEKVTWFIAQSQCTSNGAHLAEVESAAESTYLEKYSTTNKRGYWLGGRDNEHEGVWKWVYSNKNFTYKNWYPGEPNNDRGGESCLQYASPPLRHWNDIKCTFNISYICETGLLSSGPEVPVIG